MCASDWRLGRRADELFMPDACHYNVPMLSNGKWITSDRTWFILVNLIAGLCLFFGWRVFWFLTDDAFIAFRYISNHIMGYGYVWNAPPFRPVEGYTSLLWIILLEGVWRLTGIEPPQSANVISLLFAQATLVMVSAMIWQLKWRNGLKPYHMLFIGLALLGVLSNRTFLAWSSSGLETAMFNFWLVAWVYCGLYLNPGILLRDFLLSILAGLCYLTRPDGVLFIAATTALIFWDFRMIGWKNFISATPMIVLPIHLAWRLRTYGEWLPNTYYAKVVGWTLGLESGWRYILSFIMEYSLWVWLGLFVVLAIGRLLEPLSIRIGHNSHTWITAGIVLGALGLHLGYYTFIIGGDHFEYRVYSHLVPLLWVSIIWMINQLTSPTRIATGLVMLALIASWPVPWTHWALSRHLNTRQETAFLHISIAKSLQEYFPQLSNPLVGYLEYYDSLQYWLIERAICMRYQEHKIFTQYLLANTPSRQQGIQISGQGYPVMAVNSAGVYGWVLPHINLIDRYGLNDYVIARQSTIASYLIGHQKLPPPGYVECFEPNVYLDGQKIIVAPRKKPLTSFRIQQCERKYEKLLMK